MDPLDEPTGPVRIGLVGTAVDAIPGLESVEAALDVAFHETEDLDRVEPSLVLCRGLDGCRSVASRGVDAPILLVEPPRTAANSTDAAVEWDSDHTPPLSVAPAETADAVRTLCETGGHTRRLATLSMKTDATTDLAVSDLALVTAEPGTIATFTATSRGEPITDVRADGL